MPRREIEGDWVMGWPDRKRYRFVSGKDQEGRIIHSRSPYFELEGLITPTDAYYIVAQLQVPEPVHPEDYTFRNLRRNRKSQDLHAQTIFGCCPVTRSAR